MMLVLDGARGVLGERDGDRCFDPARREWRAGRPGGEALSVVAAATWLQRESGHPLRQPIGVIGPSDANAAQLAAAEAVGRGLAAIGLVIVCGGRGGVMEMACRGAAAGGGLSIGLLPGIDASAANPFVSVPLATGIGEARNALIARAAFCLVAIGDNYGTLSEVALGLQFGRRVIGLAGASRVAGVHHVPTAEAAVESVARLVLALDDSAPSAKINS
jgi:uncharacterized protein (TIGR00725 family)